MLQQKYFTEKYSQCCLHKQQNVRNSHRRCFIKKGVLKNFAKFSGKRLCQSLFFNKVNNKDTRTTSLTSCCLYCKGYIRYKTIFCHTVALDVQLMFLFEVKIVSFTRYLDFCVYVKSTDFKICDVIISIAT